MDLNADVGQSFGSWSMGDDASMLRLVSSANVACGFHAGDPLTMLDSCRAAFDLDVRVGAHVGYPDLAGFGGRALDMSFDELFVDRAYNPDGTLVPRSQEGAVLQDSDDAVAQAVRLATRGEVVAHDGTVVAVEADSLWIHGDTPEALAMAGAVRKGLVRAGVEIQAFA